MKNIRNIIKELIKEIEEELEEATVTSDIQGYSTPFAFAGKKGKKKKRKISTNSTGYDIVKEDINDKDLKLIKSVIRNEVADILKTIWLKRATWKQG